MGESENKVSSSISSPNQPQNNLFNIFYKLGDIYRRGDYRLLPAECKDLLHKAGCTFTGIYYMLRIAFVSSSSLRFIRRSFPKPRMAVSALLKSWAIPPASWPTASIFWEWRSWASRFLCSVISCTTQSKYIPPFVVIIYAPPRGMPFSCSLLR